jgi:hypothetical protein
MKYEISDKVKKVEGGWECCEHRLKSCKSNYNNLFDGAIIVSTYKGDDGTNWYEIEDVEGHIYGNWITEEGLELIEHPLIEEAKKRYPIGTTFVPAHLLTEKNNDYCIVTNSRFKIYEEDYVYILTDEGRKNSTEAKYGSTAPAYERIVFAKGKWARIISSPKSTPFDHLVKGEIYQYDYNKSDKIVIGRCNESGTCRVSCFLQDYEQTKRFDNTGGDLCAASSVYSPSPEYKKWFEYCEKHNKFVTFDKFSKMSHIPLESTSATISVPKFKIGDAVKICNSHDDVNRWGYLYNNDGENSYEKIDGVGGHSFIISDVWWSEEKRHYFYKRPYDGWVAEYTLSLVQEEPKPQPSTLIPATPKFKIGQWVESVTGPGEFSQEMRKFVKEEKQTFNEQQYLNNLFNKPLTITINKPQKQKR